jgi:hypothetical protein
VATRPVGRHDQTGRHVGKSGGAQLVNSAMVRTCTDSALDGHWFQFLQISQLVYSKCLP